MDYQRVLERTLRIMRRAFRSKLKNLLCRHIYVIIFLSIIRCRHIARESTIRRDHQRFNKSGSSVLLLCTYKPQQCERARTNNSGAIFIDRGDVSATARVRMLRKKQGIGTINISTGPNCIWIVQLLSTLPEVEISGREKTNHAPPRASSRTSLTTMP